MKTTEEILGILCGSDNDAKAVMLQGLFKSPGDVISGSIPQEIEKLTKDSDIAIRFWAKKVKSKIIPPAAPPAKAPESEVKSQSAPLPLDLLFKKLSAENTQRSSFVSLAVLTQILEKRVPSTVEPLLAYLDKCQDVIQISFLTKNIGVFFPSEDLIPKLARYLKHDDDRIVANTIEGLEAIQSPKTVLAMSQMLSHHSHRVKANAAKALMKQEPKTAIKVISQMLESRQKPHFVIAAFHAIGELKMVEFLPALGKLVDDLLVGESAIKAIVSIGGEAAIDCLEAALKNPNSSHKAKIKLAVQNLKDPTRVQEVEVKEITGNAVPSQKDRPLNDLVVGPLRTKGFETEEQKPVEEISNSVAKDNDVLKSIKHTNEDATTLFQNTMKSISAFCIENKYSIFKFSKYSTFLILALVLGHFLWQSSSTFLVPPQELQKTTPTNGKVQTSDTLGATRQATLASGEPRREPDWKRQNRMGVMYIVNEQTPYTGIFFDEYPNGQLKSEITYKDGEWGVYKNWRENGQPKSEGAMDKEFRPYGVQKEWYENGNLKSETTYKDGEPDGGYKSWYENGNLMTEGAWKDNKLDGVCKMWYENGNLMTEGVWKDHALVGVGKMWDEKGHLRAR